MTWIRRIEYPESTGYLRELYDRVKGPAGNIDNVMKVHCLRPHTMEGHSAIYKSVMHHTGNTLPVWLLEAVGVYTSLCNGCDYSVQHHYTGLRRQLADDERADAIFRALAARRPEDVFDGRDLAFLRYAAKLTRAPADMTEDDVVAMRDAGADDGEIFEVNQVCAYFNYSNRLLNGLGITTDGDILGESPPETDDVTDWRHKMSPAAGDFETIPVIDVGPLRSGQDGALERIAEQMREASETAGFFCVIGHGVQDEVCRKAQQAAAAYFARPDNDKRALAVNDLHRGYVGFGQTKLSDDARVDLKESFVWGLELGADDPDVRAGKALMGPNQWPADMPEFRGALTDFYELLSACARLLLRPLAVGIDLPEDWFLTRFEKPLARGAVLRYPPQPPSAPGDQFGTSAHTDYGGITLVWQDENGGLEVKNPRGEWVAATPIPGAFVVNVGDLLERWTNHRFASNYHRVTNRSGRERYSMALFFDPDFDTTIECIETCTSPEDPPRHSPVRCGDYIEGRFNNVFEYRK